RFVLINLFNLAGKALERPGLDAHSLASRIRKLRLRLFSGLCLLIHDLIDFLWRQWRRVVSTDETRHLRRRLNHVKDIVRDVAALVAVNLHQYVTGIKHAGRLDTLVAAHLDDRFRGHQNLRYLILEIGVTDTRLQTVAYLFLVSRVRMKNKPLLHYKLLSLTRSLTTLRSLPATTANPKPTGSFPYPPETDTARKIRPRSTS